MGGWIDSHCHLDSLDDPADAVERARAAGVEAIVAVGEDLESSRAATGLASVHEPVWAAVGQHPHQAKTLSGDVREALTALAKAPKVVAIGETGLDHYRDLSPRTAQAEAFRWHIALAKDLDLAIVIHMRDAHDQVYRILSEEGAPERLVFHCFSGGPDEARLALDLGGFLSFAGNISFPSTGDLRAAARVCPPDRLLVETDSPYLAPMPHRGKRNEPAFVSRVGEVLAEVLGRPGEEVAKATRANAVKVFRLPPNVRS